MPFDVIDSMKSWRHHIHAHPEVSRQESATAAFVCARLAEMGVKFTAGIGGHGVVASLTRGASNRSVACARIWTRCPLPKSPAHPTPQKPPA